MHHARPVSIPQKRSCAVANQNDSGYSSPTHEQPSTKPTCALSKRKTGASSEQERVIVTNPLSKKQKLDHCSVDVQHEHDDDTNNLTSSGYIYQIPIQPTRNRRERIRQCRKFTDQIAALRLVDYVGLREWEWAAGEPEDEYDEEEDPFGLAAATAFMFPNQQANTTTKMNTKHNSNHNAEDNGASKPQTYQQRREAFTYTRADDPMFRGRRAEVTRRWKKGAVVWSTPIYGSEVDEPCYHPVIDEWCEW